ncbi:RIP metalloprotease RseP [Agrobacterium vitis]|uniref:RIP metalloprotease RseP n=1 Tax=Agrobacterium vitis TaxID=373 RepID=UPI000871EAF5|nr:RIP metalloprotease RseP [Agrobacterium vitis]MCE6073505.1 RIP metalloprotease RseP [Agrobacterium vitis]MCM2469436.1 RIP metalloprotease RseP [Agrobacterium vitis]MUO69091.1 RIP metalloprotease RseP [Agrobacterium vitis]MUO83641.1 RIP metalloprotease RseP [Agrobacterium vitis]MVA33853.1 RIP metalloprotease RseP [Agrobacterium vitis]
MAVIGFLTGYIIPFVLVLSLIVFVHEMGHYLVGRWSGIRILAFSLGFGPELIGFNDRHGTRWKLSAIPLGGYVRFFGDADASSKTDAAEFEALSPEDRARTLNGAKLWKRAATVAAGPIANFLLAILIFSVTFSLYGKPVSDPVVAEVKALSAAAEAGVQPGDVLVALDGSSVKTFDDVVRYVSVRPLVPIVVTVKRGESQLDLSMTPRRTETTDRFGNKMEVGQIGIMTTAASGNFRVEKLGFIESVSAGVDQTWNIVTGTYDYLANLFAGRMNADQLGGPIRVAQASGQVATLGAVALLQLAAVLSVSIGLLNLMPVPVLDGGHLILYALEAVRGKPVSAGAQEIAFKVGMVMILSLMVFATWNDISRLIG